MAVVLVHGILGHPLAGQDRPLPLEPSGDLDRLTGEEGFPLQITGFGVGTYQFDTRTRNNTFQAGKLALSVFREITPHLWLFGQLTTLLESGEEGEGEGDEEVATSTEIDNLLINLTMPGAPNVNLSFGKLDAPIGFERDDEPLNLQASTSFNFELGRPAKLVGMVGRWTLSPSVNLTGVVANGWESEVDPNRGKTGLLRLGVLPTEHASVGVSGMFGQEGEADEVHDRYLINLDYALQPTRGLIIAGEANYGGDRSGIAAGEDATWKGATLTIFGRLKRQFGVTVRGEVFDDTDGARTGIAQTLESFTVAPVVFLGVGREGIFANVEHTTFRIPRFQLRAEMRLDHSSQPFFPVGEEWDIWGLRIGLQLVTVF